jgi:RNA recognition motif-containing protein
VEFADEAQASHAVLKLDGTVVDDNQISVSISNPPRKNLKDQGGFGGSMSTSMPRQVYGS